MKYYFCFIFFCVTTQFGFGQVDREAAIHFNEAVIAFKSNNYEGAIDSYGKAIGIDPNYTKARYNRAKAFLRTKQFKRALGDLNECVKTDPTNTNAWKYKGYAYMQIKNYPGAINSYNKALSLDDSLDDCRAYRALALMQEGKYKGASKDLELVIQKAPENGSALFNLAVCQSKMKDTEKAKATYGRLIKMNFKLKLVALERAKLLLNGQDFAAAIEDLDLVIQEGGDKCEPYYLRGYCKLKMDRLAEADEDFKEAISLNENHRPSIQNKAFTSFKLKNYKEAVEDFSRVLEISPDDQNTKVNRGLSSLKLKDYASAHMDFSEVIEVDPNHATAFYNRASASLGLQKNQDACNDMRQAARLGYEEAFNHIQQICGPK